VAHAEASAKTVDAAVTAAAAQLGLRSDQVDVEVLEDPVPSTFGYIGSPARVRVTPRPTSASTGAEPGGTSMLRQTGHPSAQESSTEANVSNEAAIPSSPGLASASSPVPAQPPTAATATETGNGQVLADPSAQTSDQPEGRTQGSPSSPDGEPHGEEGQGPEGPGSSQSATGLAPSARPYDFDAAGPAASPASPASATSAAPDRPGAPTPVASTAAGPEAAASPSSLLTPEVGPSSSAASAPPPAAAPEVGRGEESGSSGRGTRPPRRTYKDEPIEPHMVEEDTERAGDFLEGLLDALDVDGDITTWVDEVGGHIDLEGTDLEILVGPNGETLDALQELTRLAVLRQSKRRVRLLIEINGFRARQREQLTSMVRATVEQVIRTREDHELQPMTPAERKIVHDAVAAIDGARTESLGEEPNRRVVIRPA
jgi:spoIIIJ-associated protein